MPLFPDLPSQLSVLEKVKVISTRHQHDYFQGWTRQQLTDSILADHIKPREPITKEDLKRELTRNELIRNRKLSYCIEMAATNNSPTWSTDFIKDIENGTLKSLTQAKDAATVLWKQHSSTYDQSKAVQVPALEANGHNVLKKRHSTETQYQYRKRQMIKKNQTPLDRTPENEETAGIAFSVATSVKYILNLKKDEMKDKLAEKSETVEKLKQSGHGQIRTKTTEDLKLALITCAVYEHLNL